MIVVAVLLALARGAQAQSTEAASQEDTTSPERGSHARMHTLLEKTIFKVDVLTVDVWLGEEDTRRIEEIIGDGRYDSEVADAIAEVAIHSQDALVRVEFVRDLSLGQFLDGIDESLRLVPRAGIIADADYREISENLPRWFGFLAERGILVGDRIDYRIRGDTLRTRYISADGAVLLDQTDAGPSARLSLLGGYFVRKSEFRRGLIGSLYLPDSR
jgi:hypothetical protein